MIYLKTFKLSDSKITNNNIYPFNVLQNKEPDIFIFDNITVLYGNNGSGKSTILNIIAHKLNLKGKERSNPKVVGTLDYFEDYASKCEYELGENENGRKLTRIPENSRYIKSEEILYEIRKVQQDAVLQESIESNLARERGAQNANDFLQTKEGGKQFARFEFAQDKYSNGETTMQILEDDIEPDNLYLLDEPENVLKRLVYADENDNVFPIQMNTEKEIQVKDYLTKSNLPASDYVINPYVGCPHGCKYCYASFMKRFTGHKEEWGNFIDIKRCDKKINTKKLENKTVFLSSVTDCYNEFEEKYNICSKHDYLKIKGDDDNET